MTLPRDELDRLDLLVQQRTGIAPSRVHAATREQVLRRAMERTGSPDLASYRARVEHDPELFADLIADFTVPESYFFRDAPQFERLRQEIVPALIATRRGDQRLNVWSAGCAGGEEPYSLAILLERMGLTQRSRVLGSDISRAAIRRATRARYSRWSLRALSSAEVASYFVEQRGQFELLPRIRNRVRFVVHNLALDRVPRGAHPTGFDLILCRNVLIYFSPEAVALVLRRMCEALAEGGALLLGASDPVVALGAPYQHTTTVEGTVYRRVGGRPLPTLGSARTLLQPPAPPPGAASPASSPAAHAHSSPLARASARASGTPPRRSEEHEEDEQALHALQRIARERGSEAAEVACRDELARRPLAASLHALHATLLAELGRSDEAPRALRRALYLDRSLPSAQLLDGMLAERRRENARARRAYLRLAAACRGQPETWVDPVSGLRAGELSAIADARLAALGASQR